MGQNIGYLYYKEYFNGLKFDNNGKASFDNPINKKLFDLELSNYDYLFKDNANKSIILNTIYPGLLIGSGYIHEIGGQDDELKLGFFFDYTSGLPIIPGSSVKGVLRAAFKKVKGAYIKSLLQDLNIIYDNEISELEIAIFDNNSTSIYNRDVFLDAYPIQSDNENNIFFSNDYITHHENPLQNPNPVQFLKVLPNVQFQFNFKLTNSGGLSVENKLELFKQILLDLGIGAKTNVGYGQFELREEERLKEKHERALIESKALLKELERKAAEKEESKSEAEKTIIKGAKLNCKVVDTTKKDILFMFEWDSDLVFKKRKSKLNIELAIGTNIEINIVADYYTSGNVLFSNDIRIILEE